MPADTKPIEARPPTTVMAPARTDEPSALPPPPVGPHEPRSDPASPPPPPPPSATAAPATSRRRVRLFVAIAALALLIAGAAAAVLFGTGAIGGNESPSDDAFVVQVNENVLGPLRTADDIASESASASDGTFNPAVHGGRIVEVSDGAAAYLRAMNGLSTRQQRQVELLLAFVAANRRYGQAFAAFAVGNAQTQVALDRAAADARAAIATAESGLPADLQLPSTTAVISLRSAPAPPPPAPPPPSPATSQTTNQTPAPEPAAVYVQRVDGLLRQSRAVVLALRSFVPRAASDAISRSQAVALARSYLRTRRLELAQARALRAPTAFAPAQRLLLRSLQASVADDQALVDWTVARRDGSGGAQAAFDRANRIGTQATALKQQFLRVYGPPRQTTTGRSPASLPDIF